MHVRQISATYALKAAIASSDAVQLQLCPDSAHRAVQSGALDLLWAPDGLLHHCDLSNGSANLVDRLLFLRAYTRAADTKKAALLRCFGHVSCRVHEQPTAGLLQLRLSASRRTPRTHRLPVLPIVQPAILDDGSVMIGENSSGLRRLAITRRDTAWTIALQNSFRTAPLEDSSAAR